MPSLLILVPLLGLLILNLPFKHTMKRLAFWFAVALFVVQMALAIFHTPGYGPSNFENLDQFFKVSFVVDHLTLIVLLAMGIVALTSLFVARCVFTDRSEMFNFVNLLITASIGMTGIVMVEDIFSLYVFLEITAVSAFIMIALQKEVYALEGAFKYIILSAVATIMMLSSIALLFLVSGGTSFSAIRESLAQPSFISMLAIGLFLCGLFIKGGLVPFHAWLPDAYSAAPSPVSILLAGIITKVSGVYTLIRVVTAVFGPNTRVSHVLMLVGTISILVGAFAALGQKDFKRMLAYSSISQVGYMILGFGTFTVLGIFGAVFHLFNHAIFKSLLFVNAGAVEKAIGSRDMDKMGGLSYRMPVTAATSVIGMLSTCGVPPLAGFWSKFIIIIALWKAGNFAYAAIAIFASVLTLAYFLSMQRRVFFGKLAQGLENIKEPCFGFTVSAIILAVITIGVGIFFPFIYNLFISPLGEILVK